MSPIWLVPVLTAVLGGLVVALLLRHAAAAAHQLVEEVSRWSEVATGLARLGGAGSPSGGALAEDDRR